MTRNSSPDAIFVIGSARSGSTLLYNILCSDPDTNPALNETHLLAGLCNLYRFSLQRLEIEQGNYFSSEEDTTAFFRGYVTQFLNRTRRLHEVAGPLVLKSIVLAPSAPVLAKLHPEAYFCLCVRDPRDIVASMIEVGTRQELQGLPNQFPRDVLALSHAVLGSYQPCINELQGSLRNRLAIVKYETLVRNVQSVLVSLCEATGLNLSGYDPQNNWPRNSIDVEARKQAGAPFLTTHWGKGINSTSVGNYRTRLTPQETAIIENICRRLFDLFEYTIGS